MSHRIAVEVIVDPIRSVGIAAISLAILAGLLVGGWIGGELHYRNCLQGVELRYPVAYQQGEPGSGSYGKYGNSFLSGGSFVFYEKAQRDRAISGFSRWP